jgi:phospholipid/cholesterol/gamma-HCH transport system substrate-binding protein
LTINETTGISDADIEDAIPEQAGQRHIRLGSFIIAGVVATIVLLFQLTDPADFRGRYKINTVVDNVMGLRKGDPVQMRGVTIGRVGAFGLDGQSDSVIVVLEVEGQWIIPEGSTTQLVTPGLMAPKTVEILPGRGPGTLGDGDTMPGIAVKGLLDDTETLGEKGQLALDRITALLSPENLDAIGSGAGDLSKIASDLSELVESESENIKEMIESFRQAASGLAEVTADAPELRENLTNSMASADSLMTRLNNTSESIEGTLATLQTILARIEDGEGTLGRLWASDSLYTNLMSTTESARLLLDDIRENPGRYISVSVF